MEDDDMNPLVVSARFAAFVWFQNQEENAGRSTEDAHAFARAHWETFLPLANEGWGRLLIAMADRPRKVRQLARQAARAMAEGLETMPAVAVQAESALRETSSMFGYSWTGADM
jgi:hypothetical protein